MTLSPVAQDAHVSNIGTVSPVAAMRRTAEWREAQHVAGIVARSLVQIIVAFGMVAPGTV